MEYPPNSHASRANAIQKPEVEPEKTTKPEENAKRTISGKAVERKKPLKEKFKSVFLSNGNSWGEQVVESIVVPMIKGMLVEVAAQIGNGLRQGIEDMLNPPDERGDRVRASSFGPARTRINYNHMSSSYRRPEDRPPIGYRSYRRSNEVKDVILDSLEECEWVIEQLDAMCDDPKAGYCTVGDFYELVKIAPSSTDHQWGWTNLSKARVSRVGMDEFLISMPPPRPVRS